MKNLLEFLLIHLCHHPEDVRVEETPTEREVIFTLYVHPEDMGRVIGKNGSIIQAIRNIAKVRAIKEGIRAHIVLADPEDDGSATESMAEIPETEAAAA